ncbi:MAG: hypothetical protein K1X85_00820 [Ignavibacteria bacterium]|nr:hypothetical protein [Ignavibacteria bacterium]
MKSARKDDAKSGTDPIQRSSSHGKKLLIAVVLLACSAVLGYYHFRDPKPEIRQEPLQALPTGEKVSAGIDSVLSTFGIEKKWIRDLNDRKSAGLWFAKEIRLPSDIPGVTVNHDLSNYLSDMRLTVKAREEPRTKTVGINVYKNSDTLNSKIGHISLLRSDSVQRRSAVICLLLDSLEFLTLSDAGLIVNSAEEFSVVMPQSNDRADYQALITESRRDHVLELKLGSEDSFESDFRSGMDEKEIRSKARTMSMSFDGVSGVILKGVGSQQALAETVRNEIEKFGLRVYEDTLVVPAYFGEFSADHFASMLENRGQTSSVITLSPGLSEFEEMWKALEPLRKRGYRFVDFDRFVRKMDPGIKKDSAGTGDAGIRK